MMAAEIEYVSTRDELKTLLENMVLQGYRFFPTGPKKEPKFEQVANISEYVENLSGVQKLAVTHSDFTLELIPNSGVENIHMGFVYFLKETHGGPAMILLLSDIQHFWQKPESLDIVTFEIGYVSWYKSSKGEYLPPSDALKGHYRELAKKIKKGSKRFVPKSGASPYWISKSLAELIGEKKLIEVDPTP